MFKKVRLTKKKIYWLYWVKVIVDKNRWIWKRENHPPRIPFIGSWVEFISWFEVDSSFRIALKYLSFRHLFSQLLEESEIQSSKRMQFLWVFDFPSLTSIRDKWCNNTQMAGHPMEHLRNTRRGYYQCCRGYYQNSAGWSIQWGIPSVLWRIFSAVKDVRYCGGCSVLWGYRQHCKGCSLLWKMFSTVEDVQCCGGCSILWRLFCTVWDTISTVDGCSARGKS